MGRDKEPGGKALATVIVGFIVVVILMMLVAIPLGVAAYFGGAAGTAGT